GKWNGDEVWLQPGLACNGSEQLFIGIDPRSAALEYVRLRLGSLYQPGDRVGDIVHIRRLQSRLAAAEHWNDWKPIEQVDEDGEKLVVRSDHHGRADNNGAGKRVRDRQFALATFSDVER